MLFGPPRTKFQGYLIFRLFLANGHRVVLEVKFQDTGSLVTDLWVERREFIEGVDEYIPELEKIIGLKIVRL